ncbi:radical SAM protein [Moorella naiadis]|uniref:SPL family radical SAM protein n=1 Tax=Moorella naiadis (nom. illeg.) TaxID=3093670 RepID=UPI003D9C8FBB
MPETVLQKTCCKTALSKTGIPGYNYCLNPYFGCAHGCLYCYADTVLRFFNRAEKWGEFVAAKENFPEVLRRELRRKRTPVGRVLLSAVTDAYQPAEAGLGLTRASLEVLTEERPDIELDLLTKSDLVVRDADLLKELKNCSVGFTLTTPDDAAAGVLEPRAALPSARLRAAGRLVAEGISVWAFIAPVLPGVSNAPEVLEELIAVLSNAGVREVYLDSLNPYQAAVKRLRVAYRARFPHALKHLERYLSNPREYLQPLRRRVEFLSRKYGYDLKLN